jgi:hypothetical protein
MRAPVRDFDRALIGIIVISCFRSVFSPSFRTQTIASYHHCWAAIGAVDPEKATLTVRLFANELLPAEERATDKNPFRRLCRHGFPTAKTIDGNRHEVLGWIQS